MTRHNSYLQTFIAVTAAWKIYLQADETPAEVLRDTFSRIRSRRSRTVQCIFGGAGTECQETIRKQELDQQSFREKSSEQFAQQLQKAEDSLETCSRAGFKDKRTE